jgi:hypothetical protein
MALSGLGPVARHPKYLLEIFTASELEEWKAFFQLFPFGPDQLMGMIARAHADMINMNAAEGSQPVEPKDLLPGDDADTRWQRIEETIEEELLDRRLERAERRRLAKMSPEERAAEEQRRFIAERHAKLDV